MKDNLTNLLEVKNKTDTTADLYFYGDIVSSWWGAWDDTDQYPEIVRNFLDEVQGKKLNIHINSGGGSVFAGIAIYNMIKNFNGKKTVYIDGLAGSIASVIALAGDQVIMRTGSSYMIHKPSICLYGGYNSNDMRKMATDLDVIQDCIMEIYHANLTDKAYVNKIEEMVNNETWLTSEEASKYFNIEVENVQAIACNSEYLDKFSTNHQNRKLDENKKQKEEEVLQDKLQVELDLLNMEPFFASKFKIRKCEYNMKKSLEMRNKLENMKVEVQTLLDANNVIEAQTKMDAIKNMKAAIEIQEQLELEEEETLKIESEANKVKIGLTDNKTKESANAIRAMIKKVTGKGLTEAENALLLPSTSTPNGTNGEGYILPQDISTLIHKKIREYRSFREVTGYMPTSALSGSFPVENFETVSELIDFTDGTDGTESNDIKFKNIPYNLKEKAAFIKLSNTLLRLTDNALIAYVVEVFAKKAVITENKMAITAIKKDKTVKDIAGYKALKSSINKDLDPAVLMGSCIVTNQDGWDYLDSEEDKMGRPILTPNPANVTQKMFKSLPVIAFSNSMLESIGTKAPIFYGNLNEAIKFVDLQGQIQFATSAEAGFMSNTTVARLIEFVDVVQCDSSDKCYIVGEIETNPTSPTEA